MRPIGWLLPLLFLSVLTAQEKDAAESSPKSIEEYLKGRFEAAPKITVGLEPGSLAYAGDSRPCSIPLLSLIPPAAGGSMPVLPGPSGPGHIRIIEPPAPPCDSMNTHNRGPVDLTEPHSIRVTPEREEPQPD